MGAAQCTKCESAKRFGSAAPEPQHDLDTIKPRFALQVKPGGVGVFELVPEGRGALDTLYEVQREAALGEGSFAAVYLCTCKQTQAARAVKAIKRSLVRSPQRLELEIGILKVMDHPGVVKLVETFEDARFVQLVFELCSGGELFDAIVDMAPIRESAVIPVMGQMLRAVAYIHCHGVIHRDLKAENWLLADKADNVGALETVRLRLADFGCARTLSPGEYAKTKCGSPYYVAPEVLHGRYSFRADVWSLGVVMYMMLGGGPLVTGQHTEEVLQSLETLRVFSCVERMIPKMKKPLSPEGKGLLFSLLERDPRKRLSAREAAKDRWFMTDPSAPAVFGRRHGMKKGSAHSVGTVSPSAKVAMQNLRSFLPAKSVNAAEVADGVTLLSRRLDRIVIAMVVAELDRKVLQDVEDTFVDLDTDRDGTLSWEELQEGFRYAGIKVQEEEVRRLHDGLDADGSGEVDFSEFVAAAVDNETIAKEDACRKAFKAFDMDGTGFIDRDELKRLLVPQEEVERELEEQLDKLFNSLNTNLDGDIDYEEFLEILRRVGRAGE